MFQTFVFGFHVNFPGCSCTWMRKYVVIMITVDDGWRLQNLENMQNVQMRLKQFVLDVFLKVHSLGSHFRNG